MKWSFARLYIGWLRNVVLPNLGTFHAECNTLTLDQTFPFLYFECMKGRLYFSPFTEHSVTADRLHLVSALIVFESLYVKSIGKIDY